MLHPYQCLLSSQLPDSSGPILVAASGPYIHIFQAEKGSHLSSWPKSRINSRSSIDDTNDNVGVHKNAVPQVDSDVLEPLQKRQKLSSARENSSSSAEIVVDDSYRGEPQPDTSQASKPAVIKLAATSTGQHVIAVTGEDKCIRVFELSIDGVMNQLSERIMPKRPCAIVVTPDDSIILCADKFGDVYGLPLIDPTLDESSTHRDLDHGSKSKSGKAPQSPFVPSATSFNVHTKGNREALRQQQNTVSTKAEKKSLNFTHDLLLGHVSLLTDVACAKLYSSSGIVRDYILTSDRDEHIRVSRGIPQAHLVEGYCLGHTEFISKLCVPPKHPHLLISGGGDDYLLVWEWHSQRIRQRVDLKSHVDVIWQRYLSLTNLEPATIYQEHTPAERVVEKIAITKIMAIGSTSTSPNSTLDNILVTCEGIPGLFVFTMDVDGMVNFTESVLLKSNIIDAVYLQHQKSIVYSMDPIHQTFSTTDVESMEKQSERPLVDVLYQTKKGLENDAGPMKDIVTNMRECVDSHHPTLVEETTKIRLLRE